MMIFGWSPLYSGGLHKNYQIEIAGSAAEALEAHRRNFLRAVVVFGYEDARHETASNS